MPHRNLLLTGPSGVGKSTVIQTLARRLGDRPVRGIVSPAIFVDGERVGWRLDGLNGGGGVFIHREIETPHRFRDYGVDLALLDRLVESELSERRDGGDTSLYLIDEIGKVCPMSPHFVAAVTALLDGPCHTVSVVHPRAPGFAAEVRARQDVTLVEVTVENRDVLVDQVLAWRGWMVD